MGCSVVSAKEDRHRDACSVQFEHSIDISRNVSSDCGSIHVPNLDKILKRLSMESCIQFLSISLHKPIQIQSSRSSLEAHRKPRPGSQKQLEELIGQLE